MTDAATIEQQVRQEYPYFPVSEDGTHYTVTPEELPEMYEAMVADRVTIRLAAAQRQADDDQEQARLRRARDLIAKIETGTATEALAALREAVPILIRREVRRGLSSG